jgi:hypothetical protein
VEAKKEPKSPKPKKTAEEKLITKAKKSKKEEVNIQETTLKEEVIILETTPYIPIETPEKVDSIPSPDLPPVIDSSVAFEKTLSPILSDALAGDTHLWVIKTANFQPGDIIEIGFIDYKYKIIQNDQVSKNEVV